MILVNYALCRGGRGGGTRTGGGSGDISVNPVKGFLFIIGIGIFLCVSICCAQQIFKERKNKAER